MLKPIVELYFNNLVFITNDRNGVLELRRIIAIFNCYFFADPQTRVCGS